MSGTSYEKLGGQKILVAAASLFQFAPFCPPVEAMHAVTIMRLKAISLQYL